jgi:hypothetical protein
VSGDIYKDLWRPMSDAPKSYTEKYDRVVNGKSVPSSRVIECYILVAYNGPSGPVVGRTSWVPREGRWDGFAKGEEPMAWLPYPTWSGEQCS